MQSIWIRVKGKRKGTFLDEIFSIIKQTWLGAYSVCTLCLTLTKNAEIGEFRLYSLVHEHKEVWDNGGSD